MAISREDVLHVAALAQLELAEEEIERLTGELNAILAAVGGLVVIKQGVVGSG